MFLELQDFLLKNVTDIRRGMNIAALSELAKHGNVASYSEIVQYLSTANMTPVCDILDRVESIIDVGLDLTLRAFEIQCVGGIAIKTDILEGLRILETYEDSETILAYCEDSVDSVETLCSLLSLVTEKNDVDYIDVIHGVSHTLIEKLADLHRLEIDGDIEAPIMFDERRKQVITKFFAKYPVSLAKTDIVDEEVMLGTSYEILKNKHLDYLHDFEPKAPEALAIEMVGLALISDMSFNNVSKELTDKVECLFADVDFLSKVAIAMNKVFDEVLKDG